MNSQWIDNARSLEVLASELTGVTELALDAEGDGFFRYRARLCTLQLGWPGGIAVIDTLAIPDLTPLAEVLAPTGPRKLIHDAAFDVRLLRAVGLTVGHVLDTSVAARYLGEPATGLASLVQKYFGVTLAKEHQQMDWGQRPLDAPLLAYLENDVRYLVPLAERLVETAESRHILEEIWEESRYVVERALVPPEPARPPWTRVKGARELRTECLPVLRELAALREQRAEALDVPPFRVLPDGVLVELAQKRPRGEADLRRVRISTQFRAHITADELLAAIARGLDAGSLTDDEWQEVRIKAPPPEKRQRERVRAKALTRWREATAKQREVDVQVVLPGHCLQELARSEIVDLDQLAKLPGLGQARLARDGAHIVDVLRGAETTLAVS